MQELELKIEIDRETADGLGRAPVLERLAEAPPETRRLRTIYLDTEDGALASAGLALRLRHDGEGWCQTVKARRGMTAGVSEAAESSTPVSGPAAALDAIPDQALREAVRAALAGRPAEPAFETEITRTTRRLSIPYLGRVELALDAGEIRARDLSETVSEAEIELLDGSPRAIFEVARQLFPRGGVRPSSRDKAARGARLAALSATGSGKGAGAGAGVPDAAPRLAAPVALAEDVSTEQGARAIFAECLAQISANMTAISASDDPEGPHQLRVGLRRLRSAILLFAPALGEGRLGAIDAEARWLSHEAGRVRDLDVARTDILGDLGSAAGLRASAAAGAAEEPGFLKLAETLDRHAAAARTELRAALAGPRAWGLLLDLGEMVAARAWLDPADWDQTARLARPLRDTAVRALELRLAKVRKRGSGIETMAVEARHDLRKELKKLRYAVEFLGALFPAKRVRPFAKALRSLQAVFGSLQDAAMAEALFRAPDGPGAEDVAAARAAGFLIGIESAGAEAAWGDAKRLWSEFCETRAFWH